MSARDCAHGESKPDMTPMIDVVFLMIVFFVCIDFQVLESKLEAFLPRDKGGSSAPPQEQLSVKILVDRAGVPKYERGGPGEVDKATGRSYRFKVEGHRVRYQVGPGTFDSIAGLTVELTRIAKSRAARSKTSRSPAPRSSSPASSRRSPVPNYDDVAKVADACREAGFVEVHFGGGLGAK